MAGTYARPLLLTVKTPHWVARSVFMISALVPAFLQLHSQSTVTDADGNTYPTVTLGNQTWMAQNLRTRHDPEGKTLEFHACPGDHADTLRFGYLYSWKVAMDSSDTDSCRGICPQGWHLPADEEWQELISFLGGHKEAGKNMKTGGPSHFNAFMAGNYNPIQDIYSYFGEMAYFWTSTPYSKTAAWTYHMGLILHNINRTTVEKHYAFSIRCVRDKY